jgi:hypothetical protein
MPYKSFERRSFLKLISAGLGAGLTSFPRLANAFQPLSNFSYSRFVLGKPEWILHEDGTYDIYAGSIRLSNCRPTINGQSIFVRNTFVGDSPKGKRIIYEIDGGFVMLDLRTHSNTISIGTEISGLPNAPFSFNPLGEGFVIGATHFFKQGFDTGGQSGIFNYRQSSDWENTEYLQEDAWAFDSYLATGLVAENGDTLAIGAFDQSEFIQRSTIYNRINRKGLNSSRSGRETVFFDAGFETENIPLKDEFIKLPDLYIYYGNQPFGTMQSLAWSISEQNQARRDTDTNYFWTANQNSNTAFNFKNLLEQVRFLDTKTTAVPLQTILVGSGYCIPGDWFKPNDNWPKTMDDVARQIFQRRYRAGIYVAPFVAHETSKLFRNHPHWILKDSKDFPIMMGEDREGKLYALDASHEDVKDYIGKVFENFRKMGFTYYELDYLDYGLTGLDDVKHIRTGKTSVQIFRAVMDIIREQIGAGSFIMANRAPFSPLIGYVDAVRIEKDQSGKWDSSTSHLIQESYNTQYFNNVFWQNDPDVVFLQHNQSEYSADEQNSLALWIGFMGGSIGMSEDLTLMESEKMKFWRFLEPVKRPKSATLPFWGNNVISKVAVRRYSNANGWGVLILNDTDLLVTETFAIKDLIGENEAWVFLWEPGNSAGLGNVSKISVSLNSHESRLYYVSERKENPPLNMTISGKDYTYE